MGTELPGGNVLIIVDDSAAGREISRRVVLAGERPMLVAGADKNILERGTDETVDLIVTALELHIPANLTLLERLLGRNLLAGIPQLHLVPDEELRGKLRGIGTDAAIRFAGATAESPDLDLPIELLSEIGRLRREVERVSIRDGLTGAHDRRYIAGRLEQELSRARRHRMHLSVALFEIDGLRAINDRHGTEVGDRAIRQVCRVLGNQVRKEDIYGRWGATTFAAILTNAAHRGAAVFANKVRGDSEAFRVAVVDGSVPLKISAGISTFDPKGGFDSAVEMAAAAEDALTEAKKRGGNRVFIDEAILRRERRIVAIADSDDELLDLAEDLLSMDDFQVVRAGSIEGLLSMLGQRRPDLLLLEIGFVAGDETVAMVDRIRTLFSGAPVPLVGMIADPATPSELIGRMGLDRYLTKPFSVGVLRSVARDMIADRRRAAPSPAV